MLPGDLFAVPLVNGEWAVGQVIEEWMPGVICVALFDTKVESLKNVRDINLSVVVALPSVAMAEIADGDWPKIGIAPIEVNVDHAPHREFAGNKFIGAEWSSGSVIEDFANAYFGLRTWEPYKATPDRLRSMLISEKLR